jgi:hypothetical protein
MAKIDNRSVLLHRLIAGEPIGMFVDHANRDGLDCRRINLRVCDRAKNQQNSVAQSRNASGFKGVSFHRIRNKWQATIKKDGKKRHLGYFLRPEDAAVAYDEAARMMFGEYGRVNFPLPNERGARRHDTPT